FTASAIGFKCALQLASSLHVLQTPMTGRFLNTSELNPSDLRHPRLATVHSSSPPNHSELRNFPDTLPPSISSRSTASDKRLGGYLATFYYISLAIQRSGGSITRVTRQKEAKALISAVGRLGGEMDDGRASS